MTVLQLPLKTITSIADLLTYCLCFATLTLIPPLAFPFFGRRLRRGVLHPTLDTEKVQLWRQCTVSNTRPSIPGFTALVALARLQPEKLGISGKKP